MICSLSRVANLFPNAHDASQRKTHRTLMAARQSILRLLISCEIYSLTGNDRRQLVSWKAPSFAASPTVAQCGAPASARRWSGGSCESLPRRRPSTRSLRTICGVPALGCAIQPVENWSKSSFCWDIVRWRPRSDTWAHGSGSSMQSTTNWASSRMPPPTEVTGKETFRHPDRPSCARSAR
jgi:hypothetical protein